MVWWVCKFDTNLGQVVHHHQCNTVGCGPGYNTCMLTTMRGGGGGGDEGEKEEMRICLGECM